jgi:hypothetical protein
MGSDGGDCAMRLARAMGRTVFLFKPCLSYQAKQPAGPQIVQHGHLESSGRLQPAPGLAGSVGM